jgi:membrane associated rhomboid family serine protease
MIPIRDENPTRIFPFVTVVLILINVGAFIFQNYLASINTELVYQFALIPGDLTGNPNLSNIFSIFTSMFMHGGLAHIGGNMLYLWIFGDNVEESMGRLPYLFFYLVGGFGASLAHVLTNPSSPIPTVGASGAIAAVLGAYLILYPQQRVLTLIPLGFFIRLSMLPASIVLGIWFLLQFFQGVLSLGMPEDMGGVAFWAHIGGFLIGVVLAKAFAKPQPEKRYQRW